MFEEPAPEINKMILLSPIKTEEDIFKALGLSYIPPKERNEINNQ